jgi:hypothetical protein
MQSGMAIAKHLLGPVFGIFCLSRSLGVLNKVFGVDWEMIWVWKTQIHTRHAITHHGASLLFVISF